MGEYRRTKSEGEPAQPYHIPIPSERDLPISLNIAPSQDVLVIPYNPAARTRHPIRIKFHIGYLSTLEDATAALARPSNVRPDAVVEESFSTRTVGGPEGQERCFSSDPKLSARTDAGRGLGRQREVELFEQDFVIDFTPFIGFYRLGMGWYRSLKMKCPIPRQMASKLEEWLYERPG